MTIASLHVQGEGFPWTPKSLAELLGDTFVDNKGGKHDASVLAGKVLGIYFSAHWCGPCRGFTPHLTALYNKLAAQGKNFEVIFASSDRDASAFAEYFGTMPWKAIPYEVRRVSQQSRGLLTLTCAGPRAQGGAVPAL